MIVNVIISCGWVLERGSNLLWHVFVSERSCLNLGSGVEYRLMEMCICSGGVGVQLCVLSV